MSFLIINRFSFHIIVVIINRNKAARLSIITEAAKVQISLIVREMLNDIITTMSDR